MTDKTVNIQRIITQSGQLTVGEIFRTQAYRTPDKPALVEGKKQQTYAELNQRVNRLANMLRSTGLTAGDRIAILSENRSEYMELALAAAKSGLIVAALNWRLATPELAHCIDLVSPGAVFVSATHRAALDNVEHGISNLWEFGDAFEDALAGNSSDEPGYTPDPEDGLCILYTSGTTGMPKGALVSHRAEVARMQLNQIDFGLRPGDTFLAWPPMFHMASMDQSLSVLMTGGKVVVVDGLDLDCILSYAESDRLWWLVMMPGTVDQFCEAARARNFKPNIIGRIGAMADLIPRHQILEATELFNAPFANTFGATETGLAPCSTGVLPVGVFPEDLRKVKTSSCSLRLVDENDDEVPFGEPGELAIKGPTVFSGYWNADETNEKDFRGGWFHLGDAFRENPDGTYSFADRVKYMIKSGGENIYPAEIEKVLLSDDRIEEAIVVRKPDDKWGEVPVAFIARRDDSLEIAELQQKCREALAGYKQPKGYNFVRLEDFPRSTTGKIQRHEVEKWL